MKILKLFWLVIMISAMITGGSALFAQDADDETPADETVGTQTQTPWGMGRRFGMRGFGFRGFVDENGDGINDRLEDSDGDGVINALDPDSKYYCAPGIRGAFGRGFGFIDENGDGINDRLEDSDGDGVINALDPDSPLYRAPGVRAFTRGGRSRGGMGIQRGSFNGGRFGNMGRRRLGGRGAGAVGSTDETTK